MEGRWPLRPRTPSVLALALASLAGLAQPLPALPPELCRAVAKAWSLAASEAEALAPEPGATAEQLAAAALVAKRSGKPLGEVWALRAEKGTWAEAARAAGVDPEKTVSALWGQLAEPTRAAADGLGEPFVVAAMVRTLERLTGRSPEPLARDLGRRSFEAALAEAAGLPPPVPRPAGQARPPEGLEVPQQPEGFHLNLQGLEVKAPANAGK